MRGHRGVLEPLFHTHPGEVAVEVLGCHAAQCRAIMQLVQHYIAKVFGFEADVINGGTAAFASSTMSRQ